MLLDLEITELRTRRAFHIARAAAPPVRRNVFVRLRDADGQEGFGEAAPSLYYGETAETVAAVLPRLGEVVATAAAGDAGALERIERALARAVGGNPAAHSAVSAALHDLFGKRLGVPVWRLWGLDPAAAPRSSFTLGLQEPERLEEALAEAASYPILKLKLGGPHDRQVLELVRRRRPDATLRVDANTAWSVKAALAHLPLLAEMGVELLEQPLAAGDLEDLRLLRERAPMPVIADESCRVASDVPRLAGCVDGVNIKLAKCGSLREAIRMVHVARAHGLSVMLGCMIETTLGVATAAQLAPLSDYIDLDGAALLADDPWRGPGLLPDGRLELGEAPGLGVTRRASI